MTRETKVGLLMVTLLIGVFGFMVYKKMHRPSEALADQNREVVVPEETDSESSSKKAMATNGELPVIENRVITAAAAAPAVIREDTSAVRVAQREIDPFETVSTQTTQTKLKPSASIPEDDAFFDASAQQEPVVEQREPVATSSQPATSFDPFMEEVKTTPPNPIAERGYSPTSAKLAETPTNSAEADPFEAPLEVAQSEPAVSSSPLTEADPFEAVTEVRTKAEPVPALSPPPRKPATLPTEAFELIEEPKRAAPTLSTPKLEPVSSDISFTPQPRPAAKVIVDEERLGGFQPVEVGRRAMNEFTREERTATTAIPANDPFSAARRPAPATHIDEDFAPRTSSRPLIPGDTYNVEPNDNFWTISRKKYGTGRYFMALSQHNLSVIPDPKRMKPGVTIATPSAESLEKTYPTLIPKAGPPETGASDESSVPSTAIRRTNATTSEEAGFFVSNDGVPMYRVGNEDTLSDISKQHLGRSSRWVQIFEMNRDVLTDGNTLKVGTVLRLPGDASRVDVVGSPRVIR